MDDVVADVDVSTDEDLFKNLTCSFLMRSSEISILAMVQVLGAQSI